MTRETLIIIFSTNNLLLWSIYILQSFAE